MNKDEAEILNLETEAHKFAAETYEIEARTIRAAELARQADELHAIERKSRAVNLDHATEELAKARIATAYETIALRKQERDEQLLLADWRYDHTINFVGAVTGSTVGPTIDKLHQFSVMDPGCDITITLNSPGGSVIDGMALFAYIRNLSAIGHRITTISYGYAASMAGILLEAGDIRVMTEGSWLLVHEVAFSAGGKIGEVEDMYKFGLRLKEQAAKIFVDRSGGKLTREMLELKWTRADWWLDPPEALSLGMIDAIR